MTVSRDFGAPRNASFWGIDAVTITCDGSPWPAAPCAANRIPLRAPAAANVRTHARAQGWRVNDVQRCRMDGSTRSHRGLRRGHPLRASHYPYRGDSGSVDRHISRRPVDNGVALIHGHTHSRVVRASGDQFHVGVDAFGFEPVPFDVIDTWLHALRPGSGSRQIPIKGGGETRAYARLC